ncbi:MAG: formylglycine-generating enzyme family protein [Planctomycetes bacterium]|nr:formylglycine-generating enzyme family protein [Planctomycetota bacterium]
MMEMAAAEYQAAKARYEDANADEKPWHLVTLAQPFYMGKYEVTQEQYAQLIGSNPSYIKGQPLPISNVSWDDTQEFFKKLTAQTKQSIRLPTEAEWEYSCRAGTRTKYYSGDTEADLARVAWHGVNSKETAQPVGQKEPSVFGLFDMHGNLWEWCQDWYEEDYYSHSPAQDPQGLTQGNYRVLRGGSWHYDPGSCRAAYRFKHPPNERMSYYGFRVRMNASKSP